jgi:hypothetical protein
MAGDRRQKTEYGGQKADGGRIFGCRLDRPDGMGSVVHK